MEWHALFWQRRPQLLLESVFEFTGINVTLTEYSETNASVVAGSKKSRRSASKYQTNNQNDQQIEEVIKDNTIWEWLKPQNDENRESPEKLYILKE